MTLTFLFPHSDNHNVLTLHQAHDDLITEHSLFKLTLLTIRHIFHASTRHPHLLLTRQTPSHSIQDLQLILVLFLIGVS
jgi:hypothetical protein